MSNQTLQVLLSTYNGEKYIAQQLDSIFAQTHTDLKILIRDDGSQDTTVSIVQRYMDNHPGQIELIAGDNIGVVRSFWSLMQQADLEAAYFCFCDQDDVWMCDKTTRAIEQLHHLEMQSESKLEHGAIIPAMVFTATQLTDEALMPTAIWPGMPARPPSFYNALFQNIAVGATISINRSALQLLNSVSVHTPHILMHDWWIYLTISCFGSLSFDSKPSIYYRQHTNNAVGGEATLLQKFKKKLSSFSKHQNHKLLVAQAKEFNKLYGDHITDKQMLEQLHAFIAPRERITERIRYLKKCRLYRQSIVENHLFRLLIMIGYI
ncbi:glycosyltransferase family 2 protein [Paenibacillus sp. WLX1005]|uniref:glycosyltransferase family 2 protein n=1 Tax=Paenibacillus sp. WLX1005 TaxID=3243766 RepID=UPI0039842352